MANKFIVKPGQKVTIEIKHGGRKRAVRSVKNAKGLLTSLREDEYQARRISGGITFFDLGLLNDINIYESFLPTLTPDTDSVDLAVSDMTEAEWNTLAGSIQTDILAIPLVDWATSFKKLTKPANSLREISVSYTAAGTPVSGTLFDIASMTGGALKLTDENLATFSFFCGPVLFDSFYYDFTPGASNPNIKITSIPDETAAAASFTPARSMEIYLAPAILFFSGRTTYWQGYHSFIDGSGVDHHDVISRAQYLNYFYAPFMRDKFDDLLTTLLSTDPAYVQTYKIWDILKALPDARLNQCLLDFYETPPYNYFATWTTPAPGTFPFPDIYTSSAIVNIGFPTPVAGQQQDQSHTVSYGETSGGIYAKKLVAVIKKRSEWFYFWRVL